MTGLCVFGGCRFGRLIATVDHLRFDDKMLLVTANLTERSEAQAQPALMRFPLQLGPFGVLALSRTGGALTPTMSRRANGSHVFHNPGGQKQPATIPEGAVLDESLRHTATLEGKIGVYWGDRHYSVSMRDLQTTVEVIRASMRSRS